MKTVVADVEDLQKIIEAADQLDALVKLLPDDLLVVPLLKPISASFGKALYGPTELASAVHKASEKDQKGGEQ